MPLSTLEFVDKAGDTVRLADHAVMSMALSTLGRPAFLNLDASGNLKVSSSPSAPTTTAPGTTKVRTLLADTDAVVVKASAGNLYGINIANRHSAAIYVKFYNIAAASVNPASSVPVLTILVPATSPYTLRGHDLPFAFDTAISVRAVTDGTDAGTTDPATLPIIELEIA